MKLTTNVAKFMNAPLREMKRHFARGRNIALTQSTRLRVRFTPATYPPEQMAQRLARYAFFPGHSSLRAILREKIEASGVDLVEVRVHQALHLLYEEGHTTAGNRLLRAAMAELATHATVRATDLGDAFIAGTSNARVARLLAKFHSSEGHITRATEISDTYFAAEQHTTLAKKLSAESQLLAHGMPQRSTQSRRLQPISQQRVLYHVSQCPPFHNSGYAIRTHALATHLLDKGWDIEVFARFGYPNDRYDFLDKPLASRSETIDSTRYHFETDTMGFRTPSPQHYQEQAVDTLCRQATRFRPALIHTASNQIVGLSGTEAARRLGIPSIYEMRGLWHMTRASKEPSYEATEHYAMTHALEMQAANQADHVFAITEAIRDIVVHAGIPAKKITVIPNAVNVDDFQPREPDFELKRELGYADETVVGFVGSFAAYEGLDDLLRATAMLHQTGHTSLRLLLVGDGAAMQSLQALSAELKLDHIATFTGRVAHDQVARYYSLMHICAYPRKGSRVCEVVSPLKPFEAMAMQKAVIVSSVAALAEMVREGETGLIHTKDSWESLADRLRLLLADSERITHLGVNARKWVQEHRTWNTIADRVDAVYKRLLESQS